MIKYVQWNDSFFISETRKIRSIRNLIRNHDEIQKIGGEG